MMQGGDQAQGLEQATRTHRRLRPPLLARRRGRCYVLAELPRAEQEHTALPERCRSRAAGY
jgi:hypothetical protein